MAKVIYLGWVFWFLFSCDLQTDSTRQDPVNADHWIDVEAYDIGAVKEARTMYLIYYINADTIPHAKAIYSNERKTLFHIQHKGRLDSVRFTSAFLGRDNDFVNARWHLRITNLGLGTQRVIVAGFEGKHVSLSYRRWDDF